MAPVVKHVGPHHFLVKRGYRLLSLNVVGHASATAQQQILGQLWILVRVYAGSGRQSRCRGASVIGLQRIERFS